MFVRNRVALTFSLSLMTMSQAFALNLQSYHFSDSYRYSILDDSLQEKFDGDYVFTASLGHVRSPFYYSDSNLNDYRKSIIDYNNVLTLGGTYYLNKNVSLGIDVNAINNHVFDNSHTTLGDTVLKSKINLRRTEDFSLSVNPQVIIPTGERKNFSTTGSVGGSLSVVAEKAMGKLHLLGSLGAQSAKNNAYVDVDHRQLLLTQFGVSYDMHEKLNVNFETYRNIPMVDDKLQDEGKYFVTAKHKTGERYSTYFGIGASGLDEVERKTYSGFFGIKFYEAAPAAAVAVAAVPAPQKMEAHPTEDIYFDHASFTLQENEKEKLSGYLQFINEAKNEIQHVTIEGFASSPGSQKFNLKLSQKRASSVKQYFMEQGIPGEMLSTKGYGEDFEQDSVESNNRKVNFKFNEMKKDLL